MNREDVVTALAQRLLRDAEEHPDSPEARGAFWREAAESGWHLVGVSEAAGGVGGTLEDRLSLARALGYHAQVGPYVEIGTATTLLDNAPGVDQAALLVGRVAVVHMGEYSPTRTSTWLEAGADVEQVIVLSGTEFYNATLNSGPSRSSQGASPLSRLSIADEGSFLFSDASLAQRVAIQLILVRSARVLGACQRAADLSSSYAGDRQQFGRTINRFQAVAAMLAELRMQADLLLSTLDVVARSGDTEDLLRHRALAWLAADCADRAARGSHQVHGAIGISREYPLQRVSRALWTWRQQLLSTAGSPADMEKSVKGKSEIDSWVLLGPEW